MTATVKNITLAHERDAAWLIALWLAIHGGDPAPERGLVAREVGEAAALNAITALAEALDDKTKAAVQHALAPMQRQMQMHTVSAQTAETRMQQFGIHITEEANEGQVHAHAAQEDPIQRPRIYCFRFQGQIICTELPRIGVHNLQ